VGTVLEVCAVVAPVILISEMFTSSTVRVGLCAFLELSVASIEFVYKFPTTWKMAKKLRLSASAVANARVMTSNALVNIPLLMVYTKSLLINESVLLTPERLVWR